MVGSDRTCTFLTTRSCFSRPFFRTSLSLGVIEREEGREEGISLTKEIVLKAKGGAALEERRNNRRWWGCGREKKEGGREKERAHESEKWKDRDPVWALYVRSSRWSRTFRDRIRFIANPVCSPCCTTCAKLTQLKAGHGKGGWEGREGESRENERAACNLRGEESFFRSANTVVPFPRPAPALSPLVLLLAAAAVSLYTRRCSFRRCCYRLSAVCTGDSSSAQLMEVTKVEVVPSFKVAISGSRVSRARYTR